MTVTAIQNGASFTDRITPGAYVTVRGTNFVSAPVIATAPFPTVLSGVSVSVGNTPCPIQYVNPTQINLLLPWRLSLGANTLFVSANGQVVGPFVITVSATAPGIFMYGNNRAVAQNADFSLNTSANPAVTGSFVTVYVTGLGSVSSAPPDGTVTPLSPYSTATLLYGATIGGMQANVQFLGLTPTYVGLAQANIQIPNLASGDYPLVLTIGGNESISAIISVKGTGTALPLVFSQIGATSIPSNASIPPLQGGVASPVSVAVSGNYAYVCDANRIAIVDVTNASAPQYLSSFGQLDIGGAGLYCAINQGNLVEMTTGEAIVYSLTTPTVPLRIGLQSQFRSGNLFFSGATAFVSANTVNYDPSTLQVISQDGEFYAYNFGDVTNPRFYSQLQPNPNQPGSTNTSLRFGLTVFNNQTAVVMGTSANNGFTNGQALFTTIDVTNPSNMVALGQTMLPQASAAISISVNGTLGLVAGNTTGYTNPLMFSPGTQSVAEFFGGYLTLHTVDFTNPTSATVVSTLVTPIQTTGGYVMQSLGNNLFSVTVGPPLTDANGPVNVIIVDARNPQSIVIWPQMTAQGMQGAVLANGKLYAAVGSGLNIYSVTVSVPQ